jgi:hypothetical protein
VDLITVNTCPSRRSTCLQATLDGLDAAGADACDQKLVMCDGDSTNLSCSWPHIIKSDGPSGTRHMMWWVFRQALERGVDRLIYCEDDLIVSRNAIRTIQQCKLDNYHAFITFFDYKEFPRRTWKPGLNHVYGMGKHDMGLWGSLCLLLPRRTIEWALQKQPDEWSKTYPNLPWSSSINAGDCVLTVAIQSSPFPCFYVHQPSLVDHVNGPSATGHLLGGKAGFFVY